MSEGGYRGHGSNPRLNSANTGNEYMAALVSSSAKRSGLLADASDGILVPNAALSGRWPIEYQEISNPLPAVRLNA